MLKSVKINNNNNVVMKLQLPYKVEKSFVNYWVTITPQALSSEHLLICESKHATLMQLISKKKKLQPRLNDIICGL